MSFTDPSYTKPEPDVYRRFLEEVDVLTIQADAPAAAVTGDLMRAVKRAQMVVDGDLPPVAERPA